MPRTKTNPQPQARPRPKSGVPRPEGVQIGLRLNMSPETRNKLKAVAGSYGLSMAPFLRMLVEGVVEDPRGILDRIPEFERAD